jgi:GNAT superfamily N-acetyltransferase
MPDANTPHLLPRFHALPAPPLESSLHLRRGTLRDYLALSEHHYRGHRPATATRVLVFEHHRPTVAGRFVGRRDERQTVAVLVESLPMLNCRLRDWAMSNRYGSMRDLRLRAAALNAELRCISRVVVHPQWRGLGLAVRLVREALKTAVTPLTEALAAMGKVHPFFEHAGMAAYHRPRHAHDERLAAALHSADFHEVDLALIGAMQAKIEAMPGERRAWLLRELSRWHRQTVGRSAARQADVGEQLQAARQRLLSEPVYYLHDNRVQSSLSE